MIIYVMGGHGAGKSTLVRPLTVGAEPVYSYSKRAPVGYKRDDVVVLGRYDIVNGGADTVRPLHLLISMAVVASRDGGNTVVMEGVGQAGIMRKLLDVWRTPLPVIVVHLRVPLLTCIRSAAHRGSRMSDEMIYRSHRKCELAAKMFSDNQVQVHSVSRRDAKKILEELTT